MQPPYCRLCGRDFRCEMTYAQSGGELVQFADYEPVPDNFCGMANGCDWFCTEHLSRAKQLTSQSLDDALAQLETEFGAFLWSRPVSDAPPVNGGLVPEPTLWITDVGPDFAGVFVAFRHATGALPAEARQRLKDLPTLVAKCFPDQFRVHMESLQQCGATLEIRYE